MKILVIEDSVRLADTIAEALQNENYVVDTANDGQLGYEHASTGIYDMVILDLMLPKMNGYEVLSALRRDGDNVPVLILSAKTEIDDKIQGFTTGADDYMTKPFSARELLLRISAILKRCSTLASEEAEVLRSGGLVLDLTARRVEVDGRQINLTPREFDLLTVLMSHPDVAFSRKRLLDIIWGGELSTDTRTLDTHIQHIRCAIVPYSDRIVTLRGVGYRFEKE